jgi:hypothetical protein
METQPGTPRWKIVAVWAVVALGNLANDEFSDGDIPTLIVGA